MPDLIKLTDPLTTGPHVRRLQSDLLALGYDVGRYGADGWYGRATAAAVVELQQRLRLTADGIVGSQTWAALDAALLGRESSPRPSLATSPGILDRTVLHPHPPLYSARRSPRDPATIRGVTLHQTACDLANRPSRWDTLNAHIGVTREGTVIVVNDPVDFIWHAQGLSHDTIGIEFEGNFRGVDGGDDSTAWNNPSGGGIHRLTAEQIAAAERLFRWLQRWFREHGVDWQVVRAHRQSSSSRRADPGEEIWSRIGLLWIRRLGIPQDPSWVTGSGRPIPEDWGGAPGVSY